MPNETITQQVRERYARAVTTGEQMCCPTGYNFDDLRSFVPEEVLRASLLYIGFSTNYLLKLTIYLNYLFVISI